MFEAAYHGVCEECGGDIEPGDRIRRVQDGYVHAGCQDPALRVRPKERKEETCTTCFIIRPCRCDDERKSA